MRHACVNDAYTLSGGLGLLRAVCVVAANVCEGWLDLLRGVHVHVEDFHLALERV